MSSWEIIRDRLILGTFPDSVEREQAMTKAAYLLVDLGELLSDCDLSVTEMTKERDRISSEAQFEEIRNTGAI